MLLNNFYYQLFLFFILGSIFGSFYNVVINRTLLGESIILPPSKCPKCGTQLLWWHKIPIVSFVILRTKCFFCKSSISLQYPIIELISAFIFVISFIKYEISINTFFCIICLSLALILAVMDIKKQAVSVKYSWLLILFCMSFNHGSLFNSLLGGFTAVLIIYSLRNMCYLFLKKEAIGEGDIYAIGALGLLVGIENLYLYLSILIFYLAFLSLPYLLKFIKLDKVKYISFIWFIISYAFAVLFKFYFITQSSFLGILIFLNLILSLFYNVKNLFKNRFKNKIPIIVPVLPAVFLVIFTFFILY